VRSFLFDAPTLIARFIAVASQARDPARANRCALIQMAPQTGMLKEMPARYNGNLEDMASTNK